MVMMMIMTIAMIYVNFLLPLITWCLRDEALHDMTCLWFLSAFDTASEFGRSN